MCCSIVRVKRGLEPQPHPVTVDLVLQYKHTTIVLLTYDTTSSSAHVLPTYYDYYHYYVLLHHATTTSTLYCGTSVVLQYYSSTANGFTYTLVLHGSTVLVTWYPLWRGLKPRRHAGGARRLY